MLKLLLYIKHRLSFIWSIIEWINSAFFNLLYGRKLKKCLSSVFDDNRTLYEYRLLCKNDMPLLCEFFKDQPDDSYEYFKPHGFDLASLCRKNRDKSFIMIGAFDGGQLIGYCFLRCFFNKQSFRGKIVDYRYQGRGIAKQMGRLTSSICHELGSRLFATISKDNVKSIASSKAVNTVKVIKELPDNYLYVEYLLK